VKPNGEIAIRPEKPSEHAAIRDLIIEVFTEKFGSGEDEAALVEEIRKEKSFEPELSLVAAKGQELIGYVLFSPVVIESALAVRAAALAPLGVRPEFQRRGIGSELVKRGLEQCLRLGYKAVFVLGEAAYYRRFGFRPIGETGLKTPFDGPHDMVVELADGALDGVSGAVRYPELWSRFA